MSLSTFQLYTDLLENEVKIGIHLTNTVDL